MRHLRSGYHPFHCLISKTGRDKLQFRCIREYAAHTDFNEVAIFPVVINPFLQLLFVSAFHRPAVNLRSFPAVFIFAETFSPQVVVVIDPAASPVRMAFDTEVIVGASGQVALPSSGFQ